MKNKRGLDPTAEEMRRLGYETVDWLVERFAELKERPVANFQPTAQTRAEIAEALPDQPTALSDSLRFLEQRVVPTMTHVGHPRFHGYIPCPGSFVGSLGMLLAGGLNPFVGSSLGGASFSALELETLRWVAELVGYPEDAEGIFTSGGSMANLGALCCARASLDEAGVARGKGVVYVSNQGHTSMEKAASVLGFGTDQIRMVPVDEALRIDVAALAAAIELDRATGNHPLFLCANAGTTNTGVVDPLADLAGLCAEQDVWFHVDGAYGGFAAMSQSVRHQFRGMGRADSLTLDPHKWLYTPMGHGCLLVQRQGALAKAFSASGDYLRDVPRSEVNFFDRGAELSRPSRALPVWLLLRTVGVEGIRQEVESDLELAELAERLLADDALFEVVSRHLSVVVFRLVAMDGEAEEQRSQRELDLVQHLLLGGDAFVSGTTLKGRSALRLVVMNHRTEEADVRRTVSALRAGVATIS